MAEITGDPPPMDRADYERALNEVAAQRDKAIAERERLEAALRQLQHGPDTLTQDGLRIVLDALYPTPIQGGGE